MEKIDAVVCLGAAPSLSGYVDGVGAADPTLAYWALIDPLYSPTVDLQFAGQPDYTVLPTTQTILISCKA